jgi:hypothetical protein
MKFEECYVGRRVILKSVSLAPLRGRIVEILTDCVRFECCDVFKGHTILCYPVSFEPDPDAETVPSPYSAPETAHYCVTSGQYFISADLQTIPVAQPSHTHTWKTYTGLTEQFTYCSGCDERKI